jgi:hypothetical protein
MDNPVRVQIHEDGADAERLSAITQYLRRELVDLESVDDVSAEPGGPAPDGSRALDAIAVGGLLVSIANSHAIRSVVAAVRGWLRRSPDPVTRTVRLELDGDVLELSGATSDEQERVVELFLSRHAPATR